MKERSLVDRFIEFEDRMISVESLTKYGTANDLKFYIFDYNPQDEIRFMEVHDFLPHGFRVLSSRDGGVEPEIMKHLDLVKDELKLDLSVIQPLYSQGKLDEAYSYVLFRQCYALSRILPMLFDKDQDYLELLLPKALLKGETFITKLMEIGENIFLDDVEVIGWLYQFYISQKKDDVI